MGTGVPAVFEACLARPMMRGLSQLDFVENADRADAGQADD